MNARPSARLLFESGLAGVALLLAAVTTFWPDWIEWVFGVDPDADSGELEWMIVVGLALVGLALALRARLEWHSIRRAGGMPEGLGGAPQ
jgi:hypothetical protein